MSDDGSNTYRLVNLSHLQHLTEEIVLDDIPMNIVHIYAEYPDYDWVDDSDEGTACVDDAARAAILYLRHFETTHDPGSLKSAENSRPPR